MSNKKDKSAIEKILDAARKEFIKKGFYKASMGEIAKEAGVYKSNIHYYFKNKQTLYEKILSQTFDFDDRENYAILSPDWDLTPAQKLHAVIYTIFHEAINNKDTEKIRLVFWQFLEGHQYHTKSLESFIMPIKDLLSDIITEGVEKGDFEADEPSLFAMFILNSIFNYNLIRNLYRDDETFSRMYDNKNRKEILTSLITHILRGLQNKKTMSAAWELPDNLYSILNKILDFSEEQRSKGRNVNIIKILIETIL